MRRPKRPDAPSATDYSGPSKSQVKRDLHDLQGFGLELLELPEATLDDLITDERMRGALRDLRRITAHSARKRQMQYVGKLLREENLAPLHAALEARRSGQAKDKRALHEVEQWRERLLAGDEALAEWTAARPASATPHFRALVRDARRDRAGAQGNGHAFRELFKSIRSALQSSGEPGEN